MPPENEMTRRFGELPTRWLEGAGEEAPGQDLGPVRVRARHEDRELVAAHPERAVAAPDAALDDPGERRQELVADLVAIRVVDPLEVVEVEDDERQLHPAALGEIELAIAFHLERPLVAETGHDVDVGLLGDLGELALQLVARAGEAAGGTEGQEHAGHAGAAEDRGKGEHERQRRPGSARRGDLHADDDGPGGEARRQAVERPVRGRRHGRRPWRAAGRARRAGGWDRLGPDDAAALRVEQVERGARRAGRRRRGLDERLERDRDHDRAALAGSAQDGGEDGDAVVALADRRPRGRIDEAPAVATGIVPGGPGPGGPPAGANARRTVWRASMSRTCGAVPIRRPAAATIVSGGAGGLAPGFPARSATTAGSPARSAREVGRGGQVRTERAGHRRGDGVRALGVRRRSAESAGKDGREDQHRGHRGRGDDQEDPDPRVPCRGARKRGSRRRLVRLHRVGWPS